MALWSVLLLAVITIVSLGLSYLPYVTIGSHFERQYARLQLEATDVQSQHVDRTKPNDAVMSHSEYLSYDEVEQQTRLTHFQFTGEQADSVFTGRSQYATLTQHIIRLEQNVSFEYQQASEQGAFNSENLIIDWKHHLLFSPSLVTVGYEPQQTQANRLIGNYQEGWYEFTQGVQSSWK